LQQSSGKSNSKKRGRVEDPILVESVELEVDPKRFAPLTEQTPSLQTQYSFDSPPFESPPLDDGVWEAFEQEEEEKNRSQNLSTSYPSQSVPLIDLTDESPESELPTSQRNTESLSHREKTNHGSTFSTSSSQNLQSGSVDMDTFVEPDSEPISVKNVKQEIKSSQGSHLNEHDSQNFDQRSEITIDVTPSSTKLIPGLHSHVPPSFIDVVTSEVEWTKMVTLLDSRREIFSKTVGLGVVFYDTSTNHYSNYQESDGNDFETPDWRAVGYALCPSTSKTLPFFIRLDESASDAVIPLQSRWDFLSSLLNNASIIKYVFNAKKAYKPLLERDRQLRPQKVQDPQIAAWLLSPELLPYFTFKLTCQQYLRDKPMEGHSPTVNLARDMMLSMQLMASLEPQLEKENLWNVFLDQEMPLVPLLSLMEIDGILFDNEQLVNAERQLHEMLNDLEKLAVRVCGFPVNLASSKQVANVIFNKLGLRPPKNKERRIASGRESTTEAILKSMSGQHPLPDIVLRYRHVQKFQSNWVASLNRRRIQGKLYSTWSQTSASTGRVISSKPNLQNLPRASLILDSVCSENIGSIALETIAPSLSSNNHAPPSISVRSAFIASPGNVFVGADFSQLEMRLLAHVSQDPSLIEFFIQGKDIHALVASKWKSIPIEKVTNDDRNAAKRLVYGIMYGMGPVSLADHLGVGVDVAKQFLIQFLAAYPSVQQFIERTKILARSRGWVRTLFGRRRLLNYDPEIQKDYSDWHFDEEEDDSMDVVWGAEEPSFTPSSHLSDVKRPDRQAVNSVIQGTAADILKRAMVRIDEELRNGFELEDGTKEEPTPDVHLRLQIHDELLYECSEASAARVAKIIKRNMESVVSFSVPLTVEVRKGETWGGMKYLKVQDSVPARIALGFSDESYSMDPTSNNTSFGPSATHSTTITQGPNTSTTTSGFSVASSPPSNQQATDAESLFEQL
jgi:DNA polymerase I-like protein with 3'-5' exonuclease and polymerase domains